MVQPFFEYTKCTLFLSIEVIKWLRPNRITVWLYLDQGFGEGKVRGSNLLDPLPFTISFDFPHQIVDPNTAYMLGTTD